MKRVLILCLILLAFAVSSEAAGTLTCTNTVDQQVQGPNSAVSKVTCAWLANGSGAVSGNSFSPPVGYLTQIQFTPDGGGTAPDADYDITLENAQGVDLADGTGGNLSATVSTLVSHLSIFLGTSATLDVVVANAGSANGGTVTLWVRPLP